MKQIYRFLFWFAVSGLGVIAVNAVYPLFYITNIIYYVAFIVGVTLLEGFVTPFVLEFLTLRRHFYNLTFAATLFIVILIWIFNDFIPHFSLLDNVLYRMVVYSFILSAVVQFVFKITKHL